MQLTFTYTPADLQEAARPRTRPADKPQLRPAPFSHPLSWILFLALAAVTFLLLRKPPSASRWASAAYEEAFPPSQDPLLTIVPTLVPALIVLLLIAFSTAVAGSKARWGTPHSRARDRRLLKALTYAVIALVLASAIVLAFARWRVQGPSRFTLVTLALAPWMMVLIVL